MILFDDSGWEYNFVLLMTGIIVACGVYTFIKIYLRQKKNKSIEHHIDKQRDEDL